MTEGLPDWLEGNLNTSCLVVLDNTVYAGFGDTVWRSDDSGGTWLRAATGLPNITCLA